MTALDDPFTDYILPSDAPLVRNLAALWCVDPALAERIEALPEGCEYAVEPSKLGPPTVRAPLADGTSIYLHSRYQPLEEARRLIDPIDTDGCVAFYVHGLGLGYHVEQLFERVSPEAIICVLEPDLRLLRTALLHRDLSRLIAGKRVYFFTDAQKAPLLEKLTGWSAMFTLGFTAVSHAPSVQRDREFHQAMGRHIDDFLAYCRTNMNTLVFNGRRTAENIARNIGWYVSSPGIERLAGRYRGKPAIVVSAGPSLRKNKHLLRDVQDRAVIVAVQTTLRPLLDMGVQPHFVTSLDYHEICTRFFENLPATLGTELVAEPKATSRIFSLNPGPVSLLGNSFAEALLKELKLNRATLRAGATVAHLAYYLAEHLGCDPIIFVGQDLGFSDGLCYAPGTSYEDVWRPELGRFCTLEMKQWEQIARDRPILRRIPDAQGRPMYTEERLFTYLQQFERDFAQTRTTIIDATEGGARKAGAAVMTLAEAIARYCASPVARLEDHPGQDDSRLAAAADCLHKRRAEAGRIERVSRATLPLLEEIRDHVDDQDRVNRAIARIDALRDEMNELGACYDLVTQLTQNTELNRFQSDRRISATKLDAREKQRRQVRRDLENVAGVIDAAAAFAALMEQVAAQLQDQPKRRARGSAV